MAVEQISESAPRAVRLPLMAQQWSSVVLLHWEVHPRVASTALPAGTRLDLYQGRAYVGLVALGMRVAPLGVVPVPYLGRFAELNVRLYSVDSCGRRGVVFCSMDAGRLIPAAAGRFGYGLPYCWTRAAVRRRGGSLGYQFRRRWPRDGRATADLVVTPGQRRVQPSPFEVLVTARYAMHWAWAGRTWWCAVAHRPWPLRTASLDLQDAPVLEAAGLATATRDPVSVLWSPGVLALVSAPAAVASSPPGVLLRRGGKPSAPDGAPTTGSWWPRRRAPT
jgi:uncharacterized protein YqjF (DUF2071 family)